MERNEIQELFCEKISMELSRYKRRMLKQEPEYIYQGERYTFYGKNVKALTKKMQDKRYELEHGFYCKETNVTVEGWFEVWLKEYKMNSVKEGTLEASNPITMVIPPKKKQSKKKIRVACAPPYICDQGVREGDSAEGYAGTSWSYKHHDDARHL